MIFDPMSVMHRVTFLGENVALAQPGSRGCRLREERCIWTDSPPLDLVQRGRGPQRKVGFRSQRMAYTRLPKLEAQLLGKPEPWRSETSSRRLHLS